jgi:hypothetical protein
MTRHPIQLSVRSPLRTARLHVLTRLALLLAVGMLGCSAFYWALYFALPAVAALLILQKGPERYLGEDAPRVVRALRWLAAAYAFLWMLTDVLPTAEASPVDLQVEPRGSPTPASALLRLLTSLPALVLVAVLSAAGGLLWLVGAAFVLMFERMPGAIADFLVLTLRLQFRLVAYHLSLVDRYPSLEGSDAAPVAPSEHQTIV